MIWRSYLRQTCYRLISNMSKTSTKPSKNSNKKAITSPDVYKPVGPYSQAVLSDKTIYVSGVLGLDTQSNMICGIEGQARQALNNLKSILEAGESSLQGVLKTTILLTSMDDFPCVNKVYAEFFTEVYPARATFQVVKLPLNALIEIEAIALLGMKEEAAGCPCSQ